MRSALAVERDEANLTLRKLQKKVERLQKELSVCREANTELRAKLADASELKASARLGSLVAFCKLPFLIMWKSGSLFPFLRIYLLI